MEPITPKPFGKYILLDRLAVGGMAEVFRGKIIGEEGFEKLIVIKRMLPQNALEETLVNSFIDEAKLGALLQHENIIHTYDFGEIDRFYYMAMEYLFGQDLHTLLKRSAQAGRPLDTENALLIISKICEGMSYAHNLKDLNDNHLQIIHRDISPHNIFITYEGKVKIIDFGVAKSMTQTDKTRTGLVKGKVAYMSPEQLDAGTIDHRTDIFSIGALMYEMLTGQRLYTGDGADLFKKVMNAEFTAPDILKPDLPRELIGILGRALAVDPDKRYPSCADMQKDIDDYLFAMSSRPTPKRLSDFIIELFSDIYQTDKKAMAKAAQASLTGDKPVPESDPQQQDYEQTVFIDKPEMTATLMAAEHRTAGSIFRNKRFWLSITVILVLLAAAGTASIKIKEIRLEKERLAQQAIQEEKNQTAIQGFISRAETCIEENKLSTPENDCAVFYYRQVFTIDPDNETAKAGLERIGNTYAALADDAWKVLDIKRAHKLVKRGLDAIPGHGRLAALAAQSDKDRVAIQGLIEKAEQSIEESRLSTPENDCAVLYYRRVLEVDPDNEPAKSGMIRIGNRYAALAEGAWRRLKIKRARYLVRIGLEAVPGHPRLIELKSEFKENQPGLIFKGIGKSIQGVFE
ncbi:MAG: serine/threonine protein kinase [Desulfobacteraceae bacterium]|nr:MAG: serine/threonine protein kinase [Desulfobacteraceae bacterium]